MSRTKVTGKEFKSLLKEIEIIDVKQDGYGYIDVKDKEGCSSKLEILDNGKINVIDD